MKKIHVAPSVVFVIVLALPLVLTDPYFRNVVVLCGIYAIFALALNLLVGYTGIHSFGHAAFFGTGAYVTGMLLNAAVPYWLVVPLAMLAAGLLGVLLSMPALRIRGVYFAISTLAAAEIVRMVAVNVPGLTRGAMGMPVQALQFAFVPEGQEVIAFHVITFALLALLSWLLARFLASPKGASLLAVRDNEALAAAVGVPVLVFKSVAFAVSAMLAGLAGAIYAPFVGFLSPDVLAVSYSALGLLMVVVGGQGTLLGPILGAVMFSVVTELFRVADELRMVFFSLLLIVTIIAMPQGLVHPVTAAFTRIRAALARPSKGEEAK